MMAIGEKLNCHVPEHGTVAIGHRPKEIGVAQSSDNKENRTIEIVKGGEIEVLLIESAVQGYNAAGALRHPSRRTARRRTWDLNSLGHLKPSKGLEHLLRR